MAENEKYITDFLTNNNVQSALITNKAGDVIFAINLTHDESIAAMSSAIVSMCTKFIEDLEKDRLKQMLLKTGGGLVIFSIINNDEVLVVFADEGANIGMFLHQADILAQKLN